MNENEYETFQAFEAWRDEKLKPYDKACRKASAAVNAAEKKLDKAFDAFDVDKTNREKEAAWLQALRKRNALIKRRDQYQRVKREEEERLTIKLFQEERENND